MIHADAKGELEQRGWTVLEGFIEPPLLEALRRRVDELFAEEGERAGAEFKQEPHSLRLANLVDKGEVFRRLIDSPRILELVGHVLGRRFKLSSLNARAAPPHNGWTQPLHCDQGAVPDERGFWVLNTVWLLDDFTAENGALRAVPGTHLLGKLPAEALPDPLGPHPDETLLTAPAGSAIVMNAHLWHSGTANRTGHPRRAVHVFYVRGDKPQQQYQKALLRAETIAKLTASQRRLLALDDSENDRLCAEAAGASGFLK